MATSKKTYIIRNPYAYFLFGAYIPATFCGTDQNGKPLWNWNKAETFSTKKSAQTVLNGLNSPQAVITEGE